jgi:hypothetical protein
MSSQPAPVAQDVSPPAQPKGVGGWLAVFIFVLVFFGGWHFVTTLPYFANDVQRLRNEFPAFQTETIESVLIHVTWAGLRIFGIVAGIQLWRVTPNAVDTVKRFLIAFGIVGLVQFVASMWVWGMNATPLTRPGDDPTNWATFFQPMIFAMFWYGYVEHSVRVKNTYRAVTPSLPNEGVGA